MTFLQGAPSRKATAAMSPESQEMVRRSREEFRRWYRALKTETPFYPNPANHFLIRHPG